MSVVLIPLLDLKDTSLIYSRENLTATRTAIGDGPHSGFFWLRIEGLFLFGYSLFY
jgi:hypothetical protein